MNVSSNSKVFVPVSKAKRAEFAEAAVAGVANVVVRRDQVVIRQRQRRGEIAVPKNPIEVSPGRGQAQTQYATWSPINDRSLHVPRRWAWVEFQ